MQNLDRCRSVKQPSSSVVSCPSVSESGKSRQPFKVYYDVGNSTDKGRDIHKEIRLLGKTICEFHFKDGKHLLGQGRIDFRQVRKTLDEIGYSGWIVLESAAPHGVIPDYTAQCKYLRTLFPPTV